MQRRTLSWGLPPPPPRSQGLGAGAFTEEPPLSNKRTGRRVTDKRERQSRGDEALDPCSLDGAARHRGVHRGAGPMRIPHRCGPRCVSGALWIFPSGRDAAGHGRAVLVKRALDGQGKGCGEGPRDAQEGGLQVKAESEGQGKGKGEAKLTLHGTCGNTWCAILKTKGQNMPQSPSCPNQLP